VRCVSMPSWELFDALPQADRDAVLPPSVGARLAVEMGVAQGWQRYVGDRGAILSVERFGASAPADTLLYKRIRLHRRRRQSAATPSPVARSARACPPEGLILLLMFGGSSAERSAPQCWRESPQPVSGARSHLK
jgi:hypothetical protein